MMEKDGIKAAIASEVASAKSSTKLDDSNQQTDYSGHSSGSDGGGINQAAAGPGSGSPGK